MMDPLSGLLALVKPRSYLSSGFDAGGDWSLRFSGNIGVKCYAVVSGQCWLVVDGLTQALLQTGDCFLLPAGLPFRLTSDPALTPVDAHAVFSLPRFDGVVRHNGGGDVFLIGSRFMLEGNATALLGMLPPVIHIRNAVDQDAFRWSVERMMIELRGNQPGSVLVAEHLAHMMMVQALRMHIAEHIDTGTGWLFALADRHLGATLSAMHADPARRWTLASLAAVAGMSRSVFALRFKAVVGNTAMDYLTRWRMLLAADRLQNGSDPISTIAPSLGYESESAFSTAFKRVIGSSPRQYGRSELPLTSADNSIL